MTAPNHLDSSFYGFEVPVKHDMEYFKVRVLTDSTIVCFFAGESLFQATLLFNLQTASEMGISTLSISPLR